MKGLILSLFLTLFSQSYGASSIAIPVSAGGGGGSLPFQVCGDFAYDASSASYLTVHSSGSAGGFETPFDETGSTRLQVPASTTYRVKCVCLWGDSTPGNADAYLAYSNNVSNNTDPGGTKVFYGNMNTTTNYLFNNVDNEGRCLSVNFDVPQNQFIYMQVFNQNFYYKMVIEVQ